MRGFIGEEVVHRRRGGSLGEEMGGSLGGEVAL
jgi:hypothetical protein